MFSPSVSRFVKRSDFMLAADEGLFAGDPCVIDDFNNANLDDTANNHFLLSAFATHNWETQVATATVFTVENDHGNRALVLTINAEPPIELLATELKGTFYFSDYVNVDSGLVGFYGDKFLDFAEDIPLENLEPRINGYFASTFLGDGVFPVAVWAVDGMPHTFAILTDRAYYDSSWRI
jgi:hypothetical protein